MVSQAINCQVRQCWPDQREPQPPALLRRQMPEHQLSGRVNQPPDLGKSLDPDKLPSTISTAQERLYGSELHNSHAWQVLPAATTTDGLKCFHLTGDMLTY